MNRIYRLVFNRALGVMQVASEVARNPAGGARSSTGRVIRIQQLSLALAATLASGSAFALCTTAGTVITCAPGAAGGITSSINGVTLNIQPTAQVSSLLGSPVILNGNGITVNNQGTVDPQLLLGVGVLGAGMTLGNGLSTANTITVNN